MEVSFIHIHDIKGSILSRLYMMMERKQRVTNKANSALQTLGFVKRVDKGWKATVKDLESWRYDR